MAMRMPFSALFFLVLAMTANTVLTEDAPCSDSSETRCPDTGICQQSCEEGDGSRRKRSVTTTVTVQDAEAQLLQLTNNYTRIPVKNVSDVKQFLMDLETIGSSLCANVSIPSPPLHIKTPDVLLKVDELLANTAEFANSEHNMTCTDCPEFNNHTATVSYGETIKDALSMWNCTEIGELTCTSACFVTALIQQDFLGAGMQSSYAHAGSDTHFVKAYNPEIPFQQRINITIPVNTSAGEPYTLQCNAWVNETWSVDTCMSGDPVMGSDGVYRVVCSCVGFGYFSVMKKPMDTTTTMTSIVSTTASSESSTTTSDMSTSTSAMPSSASVMPSSASVMPSSASVMPSSASVMPSSASVMPSSASVMPSSASVMPSSTRVMPSSTSAMPSSASVMPSSPSVMPSTASVMPSSASVMPSSPSVMPSTASVMPSSASVMPSSPSVMPSTASVMPSSASVMPSSASVMPSSVSVMPSSASESSTSASVSPTSGNESSTSTSVSSTTTVTPTKTIVTVNKEFKFKVAGSLSQLLENSSLSELKASLKTQIANHLGINETRIKSVELTQATARRRKRATENVVVTIVLVVASTPTQTSLTDLENRLRTDIFSSNFTLTDSNGNPLTVDPTFFNARSVTADPGPEKEKRHDLALIVVGAVVGSLCLILIFIIVIAIAVFVKKNKRKGLVGDTPRSSLTSTSSFNNGKQTHNPESSSPLPEKPGAEQSPDDKDKAPSTSTSRAISPKSRPRSDASLPPEGTTPAPH